MSGARSSGKGSGPESRANPRSPAERAAHYRHYADQFRVLAEGEDSQRRRTELTKLARRYAQLAARNRTPS
jgi:hypothetical protein